MPQLLAALALVFGLCNACFALPVDMPFNPADRKTIDFEKTVRIGSFQNFLVAGFAGYDEVAKLLAPAGMKPLRNFFGKAQVALNFGNWADVEGCGCPKSYKEFMMTIEAEGESGGPRRLVPAFVVSSDQKRVGSLVGKFGTPSRLGSVLISKHDFIARSADGQIDIRVHSESGPPERISTSGSADFQLFSLGGMLDEVNLPEKIYRIHGKTRTFYSMPFLFNSSNTIHVPPDSKLGQMLAKMRFEPVMWQVFDIHQAWTWLPYK